MSHTFTLIHWFGPFTIEQMMESDWWSNKGLYLVTGKKKGSRGESAIQYCGITDRTYKSRFIEHLNKERFSEINRELEVWLGKVEVSPYPSRNNAQLKEPERLLTYYLDFYLDLLNETNRNAKPEVGTLVNYWFKRNETVRMRKPIEMSDLPDVISWDGEIFRTGRLTLEWDE